MNCIRFHFAAFVMLILCATAIAAEQNQNGYAGAKWGMTPEQVLSSVPESKSGDATELGGGRVLVVKNRIDVAGAQYSANFIFDRGDRLKTVMLKPVADLDPASGRNEFDKLDVALIGKYGQPYYTKQDRERVARWHAGENDVELFLAILPDIAGIVNITYRAAADVTAGDSL